LYQRLPEGDHALLQQGRIERSRIFLGFAEGRKQTVEVCMNDPMLLSLGRKVKLLIQERENDLL
jgi:hypothetical protein